MPSYLRFTPPPLEVSSVRPRLIPFQLACPGTSSRSRNVGTGLTVLVALGRRADRAGTHEGGTLAGGRDGSGEHPQSGGGVQELSPRELKALAACSLTQSAPSRCRPSSSDARTRYAGRRRRAVAPRR